MSRFAGLPCRMSPNHDRPSSALSPTTYRLTRSRLLRLAASATLSLSLPFALGVSALLPTGGAAAAPASAAALAATGLIGAIGEPVALDDAALGFGETEIAGTLAFGDPNDPPRASKELPPSPESEGGESGGTEPTEATEEAAPSTEEPAPSTEEVTDDVAPPSEEVTEGVTEEAEEATEEAEEATEEVTEGVTEEAEEATEEAPAETPALVEPAPVVQVAPAVEGAPVVQAAPVVEAAPVVVDSEARLEARGLKASSIARRYVGSAYRYGAAGPRAFDCSGLTQFVYRQLGVNLPHKARLQYSERYGKRIATMSALRPGDLVFFKNTAGPGITHTAIYVGEGMMVTANTPRQGVRLQSIYSSYWRRHWAGGLRPGL